MELSSLHPDSGCPACRVPVVGDPAECEHCGAPLAGWRRLRDRPLAWFDRALDLFECERPEAAARAAQAAVAIQPDHVPSRLLLARLLAALGEWEEAIEHAEAALELAPGDRDADRVVGALFEGKVLAEREGGRE